MSDGKYIQIYKLMPITGRAKLLQAAYLSIFVHLLRILIVEDPASQ